MPSVIETDYGAGGKGRLFPGVQREFSSSGMSWDNIGRTSPVGSCYVQPPDIDGGAGWPMGSREQPEDDRVTQESET